MSPADILLLSVVLLVGVPAATRNATAAALVVSYAITEGAWALTGISIDPVRNILIDATVIAVIYCKGPAYNCFPYQSWRHQLCSAWLERSLWDRIVLAIFPFMWIAYFAPISAYHQWWSLWALALGQFTAAGGEALQSYRSSRSAKAGTVAPEPFSGSKFDPGWRRWSYG